MKNLFKFSVISVLLLALLPTAFARGRSSKAVEFYRSTGKQAEGLRSTNPEVARKLEESRDNNQSRGNALTFEVGKEIRVNSEQNDQVLSALSEVSGVKNGIIEVVREFMGVPTPSNARISTELVDMSQANGLKAKRVAESLKYVANIKGTTNTNNGVVTAGNVVQAVGNHLNKARSWAAKPRATYRTFLSAYNSERANQKSVSMALETAIMTAFGLKGKALKAKKREILEYCRV